jgi:hypothetical protein
MSDDLVKDLHTTTLFDADGWESGLGKEAADEITRLRTALTYMRDDKTLTKPGYFRRIAALALRGESIKAWASPTIGADTTSNRGKGDA